jgi:radical SAM-linked protein
LTPDCREGTCQGCGICGGDWRCVYATKRPRELTPKAKTSRFEEAPHKYRCKLSVSGPMIWLSHLDLLGAMEKSLRRSGLPLAYSYGYNPHMQISWGPAHPVGLASDSEYLDLVFKQIPEGDWQARLQEALPRGLCLNSAAEIAMDTKALMAAINYLKYELVFDFPDEETLDRRIEELSASPACLINRYSKKGDKTVDIRPALSQIRREGRSVFYEVYLDQGAAPKPTEIATLLLPGIPAQAFRRGMFVMTQGVLLEP